MKKTHGGMPLLYAVVAMGIVVAGCDSAEIEGKILVKGSMPKAYMVLQGDDGREIVITGDMVDELRQYQHKRIRLKGAFLPGPKSDIILSRFEAESILQ